MYLYNSATHKKAEFTTHTPGHQDFSEDTYRVLVAADAAVMLIDAAKGVEEQTIKLFKVCRMRNIPIFTFVNKMDRASKDPFALMEELENVLGIRSCPMNWPIGVDGDFQGVYQRATGHVLLYSGGNHGMSMADELSVPLDSPEAEKALEKHYRDRLRDEIAIKAVRCPHCTSKLEGFPEINN